MACKPCAARRKAWQAKQEEKKAKGRRVQAAAIGAALAVTEVVGKAIHGEVGDEISRNNPGPGRENGRVQSMP